MSKYAKLEIGSDEDDAAPLYFSASSYHDDYDRTGVWGGDGGGGGVWGGEGGGGGVWGGGGEEDSSSDGDDMAYGGYVRMEEGKRGEYC